MGNLLYLVVWLAVNTSCAVLHKGDMNEAFWCREIQSQTVSSEEDLNKVYQEHKGDGVRVWKFEQENKPISVKGERVGNSGIEVKIYVDDKFRNDYPNCFIGKDNNYCVDNNHLISVGPKNKITELEFKEQPCGSWSEKSAK